MTSNLLRRRLKLRDLELLVVLGEVQNLNSAAKTLRTSQPAISRSLAQIEQTLDMRLFERSVRGTVPTVVGERLIRYARLCIETLDRASDDLAIVQKGGLGHVSVGCNYSAAAHILPRALQRLEASAPGVSVAIREGTLDALLADLLSARVELVIARLGRDVYTDTFTTRLLFEEPMRLVCGPQHPIAGQAEVGWRDLLEYPWILPAAGTPVREKLGELLSTQGWRWPTSRVESSSILLNTTLLRTTDVISIVPEAVAAQQTGMGLVHRINFELPDIFSPVGIILRRDDQLSPAAAMLTDAIQAEAAAMP